MSQSDSDSIKIQNPETTTTTNQQEDEEIDGTLMLFFTLVIGALFVVIFYLWKNKSKGQNKPEQNKLNGVHQNGTHAPDKKKEEKTGPSVTILYGSQSGTAEGFSYQLQKEAQQYGFSAKVYDLENYDHATDLSQEKFVVFLLATFGEGEPTDNAANFYEWIMSKDLEEGIMEKVEYAVFGLGNRQYEHFCVIGKRVSKRMRELGATEIVEHGEGDDDGSLDDDYSQWKGKFWQEARARYGGIVGDVELKPFEGSFHVVYHERQVSEEQKDEIYTPTVIMDPKHTGDYALVVENRELRSTTDDGSSTRHVELDISGLSVKYKTADNLGVCPRNDHRLAAKMARRLGVDSKKIFSLKPKDPRSARKLMFPSSLSVMDALLWYCDITSIPKRSVLEILSGYTTDEKDKAVLRHYLNEGKNEYAEDCKSLLELLEELTSIKVPFADFLEWVPKLQPRFYTISSSSKTHPNHIHVTVSVAKAIKPRDRIHEGVCSTYLAKTRPGKDKVAVFVRASSFRPPWDSEKTKGQPTIMIGPGTGVAPFRAFMHEAAHLKKQGHDVGELVLFFGCRNKEIDFIYKDEIDQHIESKTLSKFHVAFSRDTNKKVYVQHLIQEEAEHIYDLLHNKKAYIFICGGTLMGRDVRQALTQVLQDVGKMTSDDANKYITQLQNNGRFIQELWS